MIKKVINFIFAVLHIFTKTKRRKIVSLVLVFAIIAFQIYQSRKPDFELSESSATRGNFEESITASGEVKAELSADIVFLQPGIVSQLYVKDGVEVKKGERIASIESTKLYQAYLQAESDLRAKEASLQVVYDEIKGNDDDETLAQKETRTLAETAKDKAYRAFVAAQKGLSESSVYAPFTGLLNYKESISIGTFASSASPSFLVVDPKTTYFEAEISETEVSKISTNTSVVISLDAFPNETFTGKITSVGFASFVTSTGGTAYKVKMSLPENIDNRFRLGMTGDVKFIISSRENVLSVPLSSIVDESDLEYVWVINSNVVAKREIKTGSTSVDSIEVLSGLEENEKIVERPPAKIKEGDRIRIKN